MKITGDIQTDVDYDREVVVIRNSNEHVSITVQFIDFQSFVDDMLQIEEELTYGVS